MMIGYIGVIYAFMGDLFIFDEVFTPISLAGAGIVLFFSLSSTVYSVYWKKDEKSEN
jgi:drug/metabolite transporter (DMT)-like permease